MTSVAGLDLALLGTGIAGPGGATARITPPRQLDGYARHWHVAEAVIVALRQWQAAGRLDVVVVEDYAPGGPGVNSLIRSAELGGIVRAGIERLGVPMALIRPSTLKAYAAGSGKADKPAMVDAARERGWTGSTADEADAWHLRDAGLCHYDRPHDERRARLNVVDWPTL